MTEKDALKSMIRFLEMYFERGHSDDIAVLLGGLQLADDGDCVDAALRDDFRKAVEEVTM